MSLRFLGLYLKGTVSWAFCNCRQFLYPTVSYHHLDCTRLVQKNDKSENCTKGGFTQNWLYLMQIVFFRPKLYPKRYSSCEWENFSTLYFMNFRLKKALKFTDFSGFLFFMSLVMLSMQDFAHRVFQSGKTDRFHNCQKSYVSEPLKSWPT